MVKKTAANPLSKHMKETGDSFVLTLPESLPGEAAANVADVLLSARVHPLQIDASKVERIDTPVIQVLLSAASLWREDGIAMQVSAQSGIFEENLLTLGLNASELEVGEPTHA